MSERDEKTGDNFKGPNRPYLVNSSYKHPLQSLYAMASSGEINIPSIPAAYFSQLPPNFHTLSQQQQMQLLHQVISRNSAAPHYRARLAAAAARTGANGAVAMDGRKEEKSSDNGWSVLDMGGMGIRNISRDLFRFSFLTGLYLNHNALTFVPPEIGKLKSLTILDLSGNELKMLPNEIGQLTNMKELLLFDNLLTSLPFDMGTLYQVEILGLDGNPLTEPMLSLYQKQGTNALVAFLRDNSPVIHPPSEREWIVVETPTSDVFTVVSYNILCDKYATQQSYGYTPSWALLWDYRKELILQELLSFNADILCLQEVEAGQFEGFFKENLAKNSDYSGFFYPKSRARTMSDSDRLFVDGCAIFYRSSKFRLIESSLLEFNQLCVAKPEFRKTDDMYNRVMTKDNIAVLALLENIENPQQQIVIGNVHIHWDPLHRDVKVVQAGIFMQEIESFLNSHNSKASVILCGDFNSVPSSGVYEFISSGVLGKDHEDFQDRSYEPYTSQGLSHSLALKSAYGSSIGEMSFTNFTPTFSGVIDYIWYSHASLAVTGVLSGVSDDYTSKVVGFPNPHFPSDHLSLFVEFKWRNGTRSVKSTIRR